MPREFSRIVRVEHLLHQEIGLWLMKEMKAPDIGPVTVTGVQITKDYRQAHVYVGFLGKDDADEVNLRLAALMRLRGPIRSALGRSLRMKRVPELIFIHDTLLAQAEHMENLLSHLNQ